MPTDAARIFRKVALDRLSSPEQLDRLTTLSPLAGWIAWIALAALLSAVVLWGIFGSVPTRIAGEGILVTRGGQVFDAMALTGGTVAAVKAIGTKIQKGDVVATLDDTQALDELEHARNVLRERERELAMVIERFDREIEARRRVDAQQRENFAKIIAGAGQRRSFYNEMLRTDEPVAVKGYITQRFMQNTRQQIETAEQDEQRARSDLLRIEAEELDQLDRRDHEVWQQQQRVNDARRTLDQLAFRIERNTRITSPIAGHVTEVKATPGTVVAPGKPLLSIETSGEGLELVLYIPPEQGKKIAPGMEVRIEPATVKKEEYGTLLGRVIEISEFPVSTEGMLAVLQNQQLATRFSAQGVPYAARVALVADPGSPSGYAWAAGAGPPVRLSSGTTATGEVTIRSQAPITLVLPLLRQRTGVAW